MSKLVVECTGSGQQPRVRGANPKRANCPTCHKTVDLAANGNIRKHTRVARASDLKRKAKS